MGVTKQEGQKQKKIKRLIDISFALLLIFIVFFAVKIIKKDFNKIDQKTQPDDDISLSDPNNSSTADDNIYVSESIDNDKIYQGSLILVNGGNEYKWNEDGMKSIMEVRNNDDTDCYEVMDNDVMARAEAAEAMNSMIKDFSKETGHTDIRVDSAYRSVEEQQSIYDSAEDKTNVSEPGFSDYHTGYSIDLNVVSEEGESLDFDGTGDYEWFMKNCYKYGFITRFPEGKDSLTGQSYRPWHFRYVGIVHAAYMFQNGLCLEEYIKKLESFPYDGTHLETVDPSGKKYEIYYFAADTATTLTSVAVPSGSEFEISGNNSNGFIVTVSLGSSPDVEGASEPSPDAEGAPESSSDVITDDQSDVPQTEDPEAPAKPAEE